MDKGKVSQTYSAMEEKNMIKEEKKRRPRSDKKRDIKPTIPVPLKECIERLSYITNTPVKDVSVAICESGLKSKKVIEFLSEGFRRDYRFNQIFFLGDLSKHSLQKEKIAGLKERITLRFTSSTYEKINALAYALDVTPSKATALLLDASIRNTNYVNDFVKHHLENQLDPGRMKELKEVLKFVNKNNPYNEEVSLAALISHLVDELKTGADHLGSTLQSWMNKLKKNK